MFVHLALPAASSISLVPRYTISVFASETVRPYILHKVTIAIIIFFWKHEYMACLMLAFPGLALGMLFRPPVPRSRVFLEANCGVHGVFIRYMHDHREEDVQQEVIEHAP